MLRFTEVIDDKRDHFLTKFKQYKMFVDYFNQYTHGDKLTREIKI